jgi:hypothetical protein
VVLFALIAFVHFLLLLLGWEVTVNGMDVPEWASGPGFVIAAGLALTVWPGSSKPSALTKPALLGSGANW